jgi:hypothetical protein
MLTREDEAGAREILRNARGDPIGLALEQVCKNDLEKVKHRLLDAPPEDVAGLQGEGRSLRTILKYLTERPLVQPARFDNPIKSNI